MIFGILQFKLVLKYTIWLNLFITLNHMKLLIFEQSDLQK